MEEQTFKQLHIPIKQQEFSLLSGCIYASFFLLIAYGCYRLKRARIRKNKPRHNLKYIERNKIIIALQIKDFVVKYQERPGYGYLPLNLQIQYSFLQNLRRKFLGLGHYYKPLFPVQKIKQFVFGLSGIEKIQLMLYTSLQPEIAQIILSKLGIDRCFPNNMRKYCDLENSDDRKHAIEVDQQSRRVVIVTPTHDDHRDEDEKYFLVLRPKLGQQHFLKECLKLIKNFVDSNQNINNLHEELADLKLNQDSQISQSQY